MGIDIDDIIEVSMQGTLDSEVCYNVLHYRGATNLDGTQELDDDFNDEVLSTLWTGVLASAISQDYTLTGIRSARVAPSAALPFISLFTSPGTVADSSLPGTVAALVSKYSTLASRSSRGRSFFVGVPESHVADGRIESGADEALWNAVATAMKATLEPANWAGATFIPCVFSRKRFKVPSSPYWYDITNTILRPRVATQRSRRTHNLGFS